jgi:predicted TIM-barrel fold metal-dependent hydrolase
VIIDTHLHTIDLSRLTYPWLSGEPALNRDFSYADYAREARRVGITAALHMEVDVSKAEIKAETDYVTDLSRGPESLIVGAIAACRPEDAGFAAYLERARATPIVKGFRRILHTMPDDLSEGALFRENLRSLSGTGLTFDLCVLPRQHAKAMALIDLAPDVQFVLDHCGVPSIKDGGFETWKASVSEIAKRPNVVGKLSGICAYTDTERWTIGDLQPYADHTIDSFGFDRMVWGSDWPVCTLAGALSTWVAATHALLDGATNEERAKLLSGNAIRLWNLNP